MRNLKVLGLAFVAMFAMSALVASAAQAGSFTATEFPAIATAEQEGTENFFEVPAGSGIRFTCPGPLFHGTQAVASAATLTVQATYEKGGNCTENVLGTKFTIDMNGCDYLFKANGGTAADVNGTVDVVCPGATGVDITGAGCTIELTPTVNLGGITYTNLGSGSIEDVTVDVNTAIPVGAIHVTKSVFPCPLAAGTTPAGKYVSKLTVRGFKDVTYDVGGTITEGAQVGIKVDP